MPIKNASLDSILQLPSATPATLGNIPNLPGVYYFYSAQHTLLYVGKSKQLRTRVLSHFSAAKQDRKELKITRSTAHIYYQVTCGELSALLLESQEVKRLKPLHNRLLRRQKQLYSWLLSQTSDLDYYRTELVSNHWPPTKTQPLLGLYSNQTQARLALLAAAKTHALCLKMLGMEKRDGACFAYQLKRCNGACIGEESAQAFNKRLLEALHSQQLMVWPFKGAVVVSETATAHSQTTHHIIDQWHYLGSRSSLQEIKDSSKTFQTCVEKDPILEKDQHQNKDKCLDKDQYRILLGFLLQPDMHKLQIQLVSEL